MRIFSSCVEMYEETIRELFKRGQTVQDVTVQGKTIVSAEYEQREILSYNYMLTNFDDMDDMMLLAKKEFNKEHLTPRIAEVWFTDMVNNPSLHENWWDETEYTKKYFNKFCNENNSGNASYCVVPDTKIMTFNGEYIPIKNIKIGNSVMTLHGKCNVTRIFKQFDKPILEIFSRGNSIMCSNEHPFLTFENIDNRRTPKYVLFWKKSSELNKGDYIAFYGKSNSGNNSRYSLDLSYLFGIILADGSLSKLCRNVRRDLVRFTNINKKIIDKVENILKKYKFDYRIKYNKFGFYNIKLHIDSSRKLLSKYSEFILNKHEWNRNVLLSFLAGVFDGDGYNNKAKNNIVFCMANKEQAQLIFDILIQLNIIPYMKKNNSAYHVSIKDSNQYVKLLELNNFLVRKIHNLYKRKRQNQRTILINGIQFAKIDYIRKRGNATVFDIQTNGSFIANHFIVHNSYGERLIPQIEDLVARLKKNIYSRGAVVTIYDDRDISRIGRRIPCTCTLHFIARNTLNGDKLNLIIGQRSCDMINFFPLDLYKAYLFLKYIAKRLDIKIGNIIHNINSLHVYKLDVPDKYTW